MYDQYLTKRSILRHTQTLLLLAVFFGLRIISFGLREQLVAQAILVFIILMTFASLYYKNPNWAWYILIGEIFLGGAGHLFEFFGLSLRTVLLLTFITLWGIESIVKRHKHRLHIPHKLYYLLILLALTLILASLNGAFNNHKATLIIQDLIPYSFFILILPLYHLFEKPKDREYLIRLIVVFVIGSAVFSLFSFLLFSSGVSEIQGPYYKWFRDVLFGKITDMGTGFFRIVSPEHLLVVPATLLISSLLMRKEKHHIGWYILLFSSILILVFNLSRTYILALVIGLLILKYTHKFSRWIKMSGLTIGVFALLFFVSHIFVSGGSLGLELLSNRFGSIAQPQLETSTYTRNALLSPIFSLISANPILGSGIGATVEFLNPNTNQFIVTNQFDWGYLEMWVELGLVGSLVFLIVIFYTIFLLIKKIRFAPDFHDFYVGLLAGLVSLLVMNITAPTLFHVLGIFFISLCMTIAIKQKTILSHTVTLLYRVFHRLR